MREIIIGIAAAIVVAVAAGIWLNDVQKSAEETNTIATSVRL